MRPRHRPRHGVISAHTGAEPFPPGPPSYPCFRDDWFETADEVLNSHDLATALGDTSGILRERRVGEADGAGSLEYQTIARPYLDGASPGSDPFVLGAFGLPVVFSDKPYGHRQRRSATVAPVIAGKSARRASPLWLRVYRGDASEWRLRSLIFLAELLPDRTKLQIKSKEKDPKDVTPPTAEMVRERLIRSWFGDDG